LCNRNRLEVRIFNHSAELPTVLGRNVEGNRLPKTTQKESADWHPISQFDVAEAIKESTGMLNLRKHIAAAITFLCFATLGRAQEVPATQAEALDKSAVTFPQSGSEKTLLFLIGFSHKSEKECDRWNERLKPAYMSEPHVAYYELADFQGVPSFVMRLIVHGMRRKIPKDEWPHFVPLRADEGAWKKLVGYSAPEEAYVVVADAGGHVLWQAHGTLTDPKYTELQAVIGKQIASP
jgi:hypothetical protein